MKKRCPTCRRTRALSSFTKDRSRPDGLSPYCRDCNLARVKAWQEKRIAEVGIEAWRQQKALAVTRHRARTGLADEHRYGRAVREATRKLIERHRVEYDRLLARARRRQEGENDAAVA